MKHISILVPKGQYSIVNIGGSLQILQSASDNYYSQTGKHLFKVELVGMDKPAPDDIGFYTVSPQKTIDHLEHTDLIILPAVHGDLVKAASDNAPLLNWVAKRHYEGAEIAGLCVGVFLLAHAGLLNGRQCSTHWAMAANLQAAYPEVKVLAENIVVESDGIYTSGGAYAFTNLLIYLIEKYGGRELAVLTAKSFMIDIDRGSQSPFTIFVGQKNHDDAHVRRVQERLEKEFAMTVPVEQLAADVAITRRTLERRFKKATGNSIGNYLQRVRVEAAKRKFESETVQINEVMYAVGYNDIKAFREVFKKITGLSPIEYRNKYYKEPVMV